MVSNHDLSSFFKYFINAHYIIKVLHPFSASLVTFDEFESKMNIYCKQGFMQSREAGKRGVMICVVRFKFILKTCNVHSFNFKICMFEVCLANRNEKSLHVTNWNENPGESKNGMVIVQYERFTRDEGNEKFTAPNCGETNMPVQMLSMKKSWVPLISFRVEYGCLGMTEFSVLAGKPSRKR